MAHVTRCQPDQTRPDYEDYKDYDEYSDYDNDYKNYDDFVILNLTQFSMQNSHSLLLSSLKNSSIFLSLQNRRNQKLKYPQPPIVAKNVLPPGACFWGGIFLIWSRDFPNELS